MGASGEADTDTDEGSGDGGTGEEPEPQVVPAPAGLRRLLGAQYVSSVRYLLGDEAAAAAVPPDDQALGGLDSIGAAQLPFPPTAIEQFERSAMDVASAAVANPEVLATTVPCVVDGPRDATCYERLATDFGRLAFRRSLSPEEVDAYVGIAIDGMNWEEGSFEIGIQYALAAFLQSPNFLYIVELGQEREDGLRELTASELATRMSFFLIGRTPDAEVLDLAETGELETDEDVRVLAERLVGRPAARETFKQLYAEVLRLRDLEFKGKDAELFGNFDEELASAMRDEILLVLENLVFDEDGNFLDILDTERSFVNPRLAEFYGIEAPDASGWAPATLPAGQGRTGILTRAGFLSAFSHPALNSPTRRGLFVQESILCNEFAPPPPGVSTTLPEPTQDTTLRERLEVHMEDAACSSCHLQMDPLGFAFEAYDPVGAYRTKDNGFPVDTSGTVPGVGSFANASELAPLLKQHPQVPGCVIKTIYRNSIGTVETDDQFEGLIALEDAFESSNYSMKQLLVELTTSPLFRLVDAPK